MIIKLFIAVLMVWSLVTNIILNKRAKQFKKYIDKKNKKED